MPLPARLRYALRHPANWWEALRYVAVGILGYLVSIATFAVAIALGAGYVLAATVAFVFALVHNFAWNRHWTFRAGAGRLHVQWTRFVIVNVAVFLWSLVVLHLLIAEAGMDRVLAQSIAVAVAAPPNYLGQKLWGFRD